VRSSRSRRGTTFCVAQAFIGSFGHINKNRESRIRWSQTGVLQEEPSRRFTATLVSANWLTALGPTNTDMVIGYRVQLLASAAAMNADQVLRASTAGAASQANAPRRGRSQLSTLQVEPAAAKNRASDAKM